MIDIYTIIFLTLAVIIFLILRRVLGQRTGREQLPARWATNDNLESTDTVPASAQPVDRAESKEGIAEPGSSVARGLDAIARKDKSFTANHFLGGAQTAYEMIVLAYAQGDRRALRNLLSRDVYEGFEAAIREREAKGETVESPVCRH